MFSMKVKRTNLTDELTGFQQSQSTPSRRTSTPIIINYNLIIERQTQIIESLYRQCTALRQKINRLKSQQFFFSQAKSSPQNNFDKFSEIVQKSLLNQIANLLEIQQNQISKSKVIQSIKRLKWERQKKSEPIFIESKKQVRVPVPVQIIVEKPVEKIVIQQKIIEIPVFRQKVVQKFISKIEETDNLASTISKLSVDSVKNQNSNGMQKSSDSIFLGTQSVLKQKSKQKPTKREGRKNSSHYEEKTVTYIQEKKNLNNFGDKNNILALSNIRESQLERNKPADLHYDKNNKSKQSQINSKESKQNVQSPKYSYSKIDYRENYNRRKQDYNQEQDYGCETRKNYYDKRQTHQKSYYRDSKESKTNNSNRTIVSPRNNYQHRYPEDDARYDFDKSRFLDSTKINSNYRNIKKRDKYDFNRQKNRDR